MIRGWGNGDGLLSKSVEEHPGRWLRRGKANKAGRAVLAMHFPPGGRKRDELPDKLVVNLSIPF